MYEAGVVRLITPFGVTDTVMRRMGAYSMACLVLDEASLVHFGG